MILYVELYRLGGERVRDYRLGISTYAYWASWCIVVTTTVYLCIYGQVCRHSGSEKEVIKRRLRSLGARVRRRVSDRPCMIHQHPYRVGGLTATSQSVWGDPDDVRVVLRSVLTILCDSVHQGSCLCGRALSVRICEMGGAHPLAPRVPRVVCVSLMYRELVFASFICLLYSVCVWIRG